MDKVVMIGVTVNDICNLGKNHLRSQNQSSLTPLIAVIAVPLIALILIFVVLSLLLVSPVQAAGYVAFTPGYVTQWSNTPVYTNQTESCAASTAALNANSNWSPPQYTLDLTNPYYLIYCHIFFDTRNYLANIYVFATDCPSNSKLYTSNVCTCNTNYKPSGILSGVATSCIPQNALEPSKTIGQTCPTNSGSAQAEEQKYACTNPINSGTGNKYQHETDYAGTSIYPVRAGRTYNNGGTSPAVVEATIWGSQWRGFYDRAIASVTSGSLSTATVKRNDGKQYYFTLAGTVFVGDVDGVGILTRTGVDTSGNPTGWTYKNESDEIENYDAAGKLISITNKTDLTQTLTYSCTVVSTTCPVVTPINIAPVAGLLLTVTDPSGHQLNFVYDSVSRVVKMTDPAGGIYTYTYSGPLATDNLASVTYPDGKTRTYLYGEAANVSSTPNAGVSYAHALTGILDENNTRYASWTYDAQGRATSSEHGAFGSGIDHVGLVYTAPDTNGNSTTTVTDVMGTTRTYNFSTILGVVKNTGITGVPCNGCSSAFSYDANGNVASRTDFNGNTTTYTYDLTRNLELSRTEASGTPQARTITTQWHPSFRLPTVITEPLRTTTYTYDPQGNLLTQTIQPVAGIGGGAGQPRTTTYTYNNAGQVLSIDGPRLDAADITHYNYDPLGNLVSVSNALSQVTTLGNYDANGRVGTITHPNGLVTTLSYDPRGRLVNRIVGSEATHYTYDGVGNLTNVALPNGALYTYTYDAAHRLIQITDAQANTIKYTLDPAGNRTKEEMFDNTNTLIQTHSRVFDALNRLYQDIGAVNQITTYTYDPNGNLTSVSDPLNRLSTNTYDALNRLSQVANPDTGLIRYGYDAQDQLTSVTDPRNHTTQYNRDGLGNLNSTSSPDTGTSNASYDEAGNLKSKVDAKGQVSTYTYDALNRLTHIGYSGSTAQPFDVTYLYDQGPNGIGHLSGILDNTGVTQYSYDQQGRLISEASQSMSTGGNGLIYTTGYTYDPLGRLASISYPSGRVVSYTYDPMGRINNINTNFNGTSTVIASNITYRPFGGVQSYTYGDGQVAQPNTPQNYTRQYDQDGRIASYSLNGQPMVIGYDAASQISFINNPGNATTTPSFANYSYDPMSRLSNYTQGPLNQSYSYDQVGNRTSQLIGSTSTNFGIDPISNKLTSVQSGAGVPQPITQDAIGATTSDASHQYTYDIRGRLVQATTAQGQINYEVNALGLRVRKQVPYANSDTQYHYDSMGHLIDENPTGTTQFSREYIWLGEIPVAVMQ